MPERTYSFIEMRLPMPLMSAAAEPGKLDEAVAHTPRTRPNWAASPERKRYFRGQPGRSARQRGAILGPLRSRFAHLGEFHLRVRRSYPGKNLGNERMPREHRSNAQRRSIKTTPALHASYVLFDAASSVLLHLSTPYPPGTFAKHIAALPEGLRLFATYALAHHAYLFGEYGRCVGMAEIALMTKQGRYPIAEQFLHLVAAIGQVNLRDAEAGTTPFYGAWDIALADGLVEEIGEHHGLLQGVLETCLKEDYPEHYARVIDITYRFSEVGGAYIIPRRART